MAWRRVSCASGWRGSRTNLPFCARPSWWRWRLRPLLDELLDEDLQLIDLSLHGVHSFGVGQHWLGSPNSNHQIVPGDAEELGQRSVVLRIRPPPLQPPGDRGPSYADQLSDVLVPEAVILNALIQHVGKPHGHSVYVHQATAAEVTPVAPSK